MNEAPSATTTDSQLQTTTHIVYAALRFLRIVRMRKMIVVTTLIIAGLLGAVYYATANRSYQAKASLLVSNSELEELNKSIAQDGHRQSMLPTYERLFSKAVILDRAINYLEELPAEARIDLAPFPKEKWREELRKRLSASAIRATNIIEISYVSGDPRTAETVVNAIVQSYTEFNKDRHTEVAGTNADRLRQELENVDARIRNTTDRLSAAKQAVKDLGIRHKTDVLHPLVDRAIKTQTALFEARQKRLQLQSTLIALEAAVEQGADLQQHLLELEPEVGREVVLSALGLSKRDTEIVTHLERSLIEEQARLEEMSAHFLEDHPDVVQATAKITRLRQDIANYARVPSPTASREYHQRLGRLLTNLVEENLRTTTAHEQILEGEYSLAEADALDLANRWESIRLLEMEETRLLDHDKSLRNRLDDIYVKTNQADVSITVVSDAFADNRPVSPRLAWVLFVCTTLGTGAGLGIIYVLDILDDRFRAPEELRDQLGAPVLAIIRQLAPSEQQGAAALIVHASPDSIESEAFRTLRTTVAFSATETDCLAVSSSEPGDGKTTVIANLAAACAQAGKRTVLIDADMRRPGMSKLFNVRGEKGLGDLLRGAEDVLEMASDFIRQSGVPNLDMLPAGVRPTDPTGMLSGPRFLDLLAWAQSRYDQVLIDTPPILAASDATIIGRNVDGLILVVQPEKNHRQLVHRAAEEIHGANLHFLGIVANNVSGSVGHYGGGYGYGYGYGYGHGYAEEEPDANQEDTTPPRPAAGISDQSDPIDPEPIRPRRAA